MVFIRMLNILCLISIAFALSYNKFVRDSTLDNYICSDASYLFYDKKHVRNALDCLHLCQNETLCHGVFYSPIPISCKGCTDAVRHKDVVPANGTTHFYVKLEAKATRHGEACDIYTVCGPNSYCSNLACVCNLGYSYDQTSDSCRPGCLVYGDTFDEHPRKRIAGNNIEVIEVAFSTCHDSCTANTNCRTFDYKATYSRCMLQDATALTDPDQVVDDASYNHFHRNCA